MPRMLALIAVALCYGSSVHAGVYTWIDASGVAHFSDYPPGQLPHQQLHIAEPVTVPMSENLRQGETISDIRKEVRDLIAAPSRPTAARAGEDPQQKACDGYRKKLARIQSKLRAGYGNDQGNTLRSQRRETSQKLSRECLLR